jgi:hypothetical protein
MFDFSKISRILQNMKYIVKVPEVHYNLIEVDAISSQDARELASQQIADGINDLNLQYSHTLPLDEWVVEAAE